MCTSQTLKTEVSMFTINDKQSCKTLLAMYLHLSNTYIWLSALSKRHISSSYSNFQKEIHGKTSVVLTFSNNT